MLYWGKRKATAKYYKERTMANWEIKQKCRNASTRQRRIAIKQYWKRKADDLKIKPRDFFQTFKPFLGSKNHNTNSEINLKVHNNIVTDQTAVAETLASHFASLGDDIGDNQAKLLSEGDFNSHLSVIRIRKKNYGKEIISFKPVNKSEVLRTLESLNTRKATGHDCIPAKAMKLGARELTTPLTNL